MINTIQSILPFLVLFSHIALVALLVSLIMKNGLSRWVGKYSILLGFLTALVAVVGSLFYSNGVGFEPCYLCWWQRVAVYPLLVLFVVAIRKGDKSVFNYVIIFSLIAFLLSAYHSYVQWGGSPLIPCDATASCSKLYVYAFGYITIPTMSLTIAFAMMLLYWSNKVYENHHA